MQLAVQFYTVECGVGREAQPLQLLAGAGVGGGAVVGSKETLLLGEQLQKLGEAVGKVCNARVFLAR
jgi:hypothetical protein